MARSESDPCAARNETLGPDLVFSLGNTQIRESYDSLTDRKVGLTALRANVIRSTDPIMNPSMYCRVDTLSLDFYHQRWRKPANCLYLTATVPEFAVLLLTFSERRHGYSIPDSFVRGGHRVGHPDPNFTMTVDTVGVMAVSVMNPRSGRISSSSLLLRERSANITPSFHFWMEIGSVCLSGGKYTRLVRWTGRLLFSSRIRVFSTKHIRGQLVPQYRYTDDPFRSGPPDTCAPTGHPRATPLSHS